MTAPRRALLSMLLALPPLVSVATGATAATPRPALSRGVLVVLVPDVSFEQLMEHPAVRALASHGGAGLLPASGDPRETIEASFPKTGIRPLGGSTIDVPLLVVEQGLGPDPTPIGELDDAVRDAVAAFDTQEVLVAVAGERPSASMRGRKDDLLPIVIGRGSPSDVLLQRGPPRALTSDSTRRIGVVAAVDVPTTIDAFVGGSIARNPPDAPEAGFAIRSVDAPAPFELHGRYLAMRRMTVPVQTAAALYVAVAGVFAVLVLRLGRRAPALLGVLASGFAISVGPLGAALLLAGHLPTLSYATVVPFVVIVTVAVTAIVLLGATRELLHPVLPLGVLLLAVLAVESALGWTAALTALLGGSELDGGRFYGLPNVFIGLLLGACLYVASRLPAVAGFAVLVAAALLAGLPLAGANLGGAVTLLAGAGLWLPLRVRRRLGWRELAFAAAVVIVGTAVVLVAHRVSSLPTHVTAFEERQDAARAWSIFVERLGVGWALIAHNPFALVPVLGLLVTLGVLLRPPASIAPSLGRHPAWRDAMLVLVLASVVAYVANDSGPAACGVGFGMALGGLLYVSVAERTWKMVPA